MIKKISKIVITIQIAILSIPLKVLAIQTPSTQPVTIVNPLGVNNIIELLNRMLAFVQPAALLGLVGSIIGAGFLRLTSAGDSEKEQKSVKILTYAAGGFLIIVLAPLIVRIIGSILGIQSGLQL